MKLSILTPSWGLPKEGSRITISLPATSSGSSNFLNRGLCFDKEICIRRVAAGEDQLRYQSETLVRWPAGLGSYLRRGTEKFLKNPLIDLLSRSWLGIYRVDAGTEFWQRRVLILCRRYPQ